MTFASFPALTCAGCKRPASFSLPWERSGGPVTADVESALARAAEHEALGAFWALDATGALAQAAELDAARRRLRARSPGVRSR